MKKIYWIANIVIVIILVFFIIISNITIKKGINTNELTAVVVNEKGESFLLLRSPYEEELTNPWGSSAINASFNGKGQLEITKYKCFNAWGWIVEGTWPVCISINYFTPHRKGKTEIVVWNGKKYKSIGFVLIDNNQKMSFKAKEN